MAVLVSPGVDVQIIDESFYGGAGPGTVPLIIFASASNKASPSGTGVAPYSAPNQAGKLFLATSQRELIQNFGVPSFKSVQGTQSHGHELNEYGLHAAYQYLGISNRAYVLRADINLDELAPSVGAPAAAPAIGQHWLDLNETTFGVFQSNGAERAANAWVSQPVLKITEEAARTLSVEPAHPNAAQNVQTLLAAGFSQTDIDEMVTRGQTDSDQYLRDLPLAAAGSTGDFAVVLTQSDNLVFEKFANDLWVRIGSDAWKAQRQTTLVGTASNPTVLSTDSITIQGQLISFDALPDATPTVSPVALADVVTIISAAIAASAALPTPGRLATLTASVVNNRLQLRETTGATIDVGLGGSTDVMVKLGLTRKQGVSTYYTHAPQYPTGSVAGDVWLKQSAPNNGSVWTVKVWNSTGRWVTIPAPFYPINENSYADDAARTAGLEVAGAVYVGYDRATGMQKLRRYAGPSVGWTNLSYIASTIAPVSDPVAGTMWYNANLRADIMVSDGTRWMGYRSYDNGRYVGTDAAGVLISGSAPKTQANGSDLVDDDLWIDSSDEENYPMIYRFNATTKRWNLIDKSDQTTPFGIVFADAREGMAGMLTNNTVDPDAPDPRAYPDGMLLFNTRFSTGNVKVWEPDYFLPGGYDANIDYSESSYSVGSASLNPLANVGRWVTASGNRADGSPHMGRKAQRVMIVKAMAAMISANEDLRSELVYFNLLAAPGYPELMDEMVTLNTDQKEVAFIVGDTPARLKPTGTDVQNWSTNALNAPSTGEEGLTVANPFVGVYYPWGLSTNLDGSEVMVPPSTIVLRTMAYNDQVAYQWYAPAGYRRGLVTNASSVGYLTSENEFKPVLLSPGQRDVLYANKINPIAFIPNRGLVVYGQKTLNGLDSALDRVNVARLANYLKYNLDNLVKPFLFEQNDSQTRDSARVTVERFLNGLVGLQALEDYAVLCDTSNNTPERRERNELWIDIAIKPIHSIEFIYIPVRILSLGDELPQATV